MPRPLALVALLASLQALGVGPGDPAVKTAGEPAHSSDACCRLQKLSDHLYLTQRADDLFLVMERIDAGVKDSASRLAFWKALVLEETGPATKQYAQLPASLKTRHRLPMAQADAVTLNGGSLSLKPCLEAFAADNELWIAFAHTTAVTSPADITAGNLEMLVAVMTTSGAPMFTNMGINRACRFLNGILDRRQKGGPPPEEPVEWPVELGFRVHRHLAMELHAFAATVLRSRDPGKLYLITAPLEEMAKILAHALPGDVFLGDSWERASADPDPATRALYKDLDLLRSIAEGLERERLHHSGPALAEIEAGLTTNRAWRSAIYRAAEASLDAWAERMPLPPEVAPILADRQRRRVQVYDPGRTRVVFARNRDTGAVEVDGRLLPEPEARRYRWFDHEHMGQNAYATVHAPALAAWSHRATFPSLEDLRCAIAAHGGEASFPCTSAGIRWTVSAVPGPAGDGPDAFLRGSFRTGQGLAPHPPARGFGALYRVGGTCYRLRAQTPTCVLTQDLLDRPTRIDLGRGVYHYEAPAFTPEQLHIRSSQDRRQGRAEGGTKGAPGRDREAFPSGHRNQTVADGRDGGDPPLHP